MLQANEINSRFMIVVGDKFQGFAAGKSNVLTMTQVKSLLMLPWMIDGQRIVFVAGQGLSDGDSEAIEDLVAHSPQKTHFDLSLLLTRPSRASRDLSHKHRPQNTLIGTPRKVDDLNFELDLMLDESSELMGDHQTGQHIQGIVLIEAGRQAFLAVTESYYLVQDGTKYYFVINDIATTFKRFAFPVATLVRYRILEREEPGQKRFRARVTMGFEQAGEEVARMDVSFTAYEATFIARKEADLARLACEASVTDASLARMRDVPDMASVKQATQEMSA